MNSLASLLLCLLLLVAAALDPPPSSGQSIAGSTAVIGHLPSLGALGDISRVKRRAAAEPYPIPAATNQPPAKTPAVGKEVSARSVMILDGKSGEILFSRNPDAPRQPASTIKILTASLALQTLKTETLVPVSARAAAMPSSKVHLDPARQYPADDLINAVLLASANDASVALAERIAGSEAAFAEMMTRRARLWGATNTVCRTASGLTAEGQQSTARDLAVMFRHAMREGQFADRMGRRQVATSYGATLRNHNKALWQISGAQAGKTGYTSAARQTYVGQFRRGEETIIVALLGSETMWTDVKRLVDLGFKRKKQLKLTGGNTATTVASAPEL